MYFFDNVGNCKCFAGAGDAKKCLVLVVFIETIYKFGYRLRLVTSRLVGGCEFESHVCLIVEFLL